ncbi:MAG: hypothetical protein NTY34_06100 [Candidatus Omnitrophica bacterium]|nr:hypothetical protein [Candidatus Omnitrophota bacterium]
MKYKTNIEITSDAVDKDEAMEIVGDYLSGNIASGIDMKYATRPVHFYNNPAAKVVAVVLLMTMGFFSGVKAKPQQSFSINTCQMAAVTPPLKTYNANKNDMRFKKEWQQKQAAEAINLIKR